MNTKEIYRTIKRATVAMAIVDFNNLAKPYEIIGSGFCIDPTGIIVTCRHVLSGFMSKPIEQQVSEAEKDEANKGKKIQRCGPISSYRPFAIFFDTERSQHELFAVPTVVDIMMAKTNEDIGMVRVLKHKYFNNGYPFLEIEDYNNLNEGDDIGICGFPLGTVLKERLGTVTSSFTKGIISSIIPSPGVKIEFLKGFQLNITATYGNSGGPAFSLASGKVFGVLIQGLSDTAGIVKAVPVYSVLEAVENMKSATAQNLFPNENN